MNRMPASRAAVIFAAVASRPPGVAKQVVMISRSVGLLEPLGAVLTDLQQPICKAGALLTADPIQPFTDGDGDGPRPNRGCHRAD